MAMILVTGGTGFIGSYILQNLVERGQAVRALRRSARLPFYFSPAIAEKIDWVEGDIRDPVSLYDAMQGVDSVIHSAAVVSFHARDRQQMYHANIDGTCNVVNVALEKNIRRFVHVSSVAAVGRTTDGTIVNEEKKWEDGHQNTHYAISKRKAELEVWRGFAEGLEGVIVNPSTVLGFGDWHQSSTAIFKNVYKEFPWYTKGVNGFVGVEDVAEATVQLLLSEVNEKRFILNAANWTFQELFNCIAEGFNKKPPGKHATPFLGEIAWRLESFKHLFADGKPLLTRESARVAHSMTRFDASAITTALPGFNFTPLEEVIARSCKAYMIALKEGRLSVNK
jgi:dihydroflavonol-4-reductase